MSGSAGGGRVTDLTLLVALVLGAAVALLVPGVPWPVEWVLGVPLLLVFPGYAIVAALLPAGPSTRRPADGRADPFASQPTADRTDPSERRQTGDRTAPPGWGARAAISLVASAVVVAVVGTLLSVAGALALAPAVLAVVAVTCACAGVAWARRQRVDGDHGADPVAAIRSRSASGRGGLSGRQTVVLGVAALALVGTLAVVGGTPDRETAYTEASLLSGPDGEVLGTNGTVTLVRGEANAVHVRLGNSEGEPITYTIVGQLQRVGPTGTVLEEREVDRGRIRVEDGGTVVDERRIEPSMAGETLRLRYLVYTGSVPDEPGPESADLSLRVQVEVAGGSPT